MQITNGKNLKKLVSTAPIGICILDAETLTSEIVNEKFLQIFGKPYEAIIGRFYWEAFPETRVFNESALAGVLDSGEAYYADEVELNLMRHGNEELVFVTFVYAPIKDNGDKVVKIAVWVLENAQEVSKRRAITASEERLRALVNATSDVIYSLSPDWEVMNQLDGRGFLKSTDAPIKGWRNQNVYPADMETVNQAIDKAISEKKTFELEHRVLRADGTPGWTFSRAVPILDEQGDIKEWFGTASDITERKQIEAALREARELSDRQKRVYETITSGTPDLMYVWDLNYRFTYVNSALLNMWGKSWDDAIGKGLRENGYEEWHAQMHEREIDHVVATKESVRGEVAFPHATLGKRIYDYILIPVLNDEGVVEAVAGTTRDITERKIWEEKLAQATEALQAVNEEMVTVNEEQAASNEELTVTNEELIATQQQLEEINRELAASAARLRMAVESTQLGTWDHDPRSGELFWSEEYRAICGVPPEVKPSYEYFLEHIHPDDRIWVVQEIQKAADPATSGRYAITFRMIRFNSSEIRWVKVHGTVHFEMGQAVRFIGTILDITDIKTAEEQSAKLAAIIQSSDDAIISKTFDSVITSWNAAAERIFGYSAEEMIGESIYKLIPGHLHYEEPQIIERLRSGQRIQHYETKRHTKDGRLIDVSLTISPVKDPRGNVIGISKIARDITEKKLDENRKSDFIGMVSHELKTPLTSLGAIVQMANVKLAGSEDGFLSGAMQKANQQIKKMTSMINGFLNVSRLESGKIHIEKQLVNLPELITETIDEARLTAENPILLKQNGPLRVNCDRDKIGSVISNFISNAIKYSPKAKVIEVAYYTSNGQAVVSVSDKGMGINPDDLAKIFDRYFRVETNHTRHIAGFGIGLYLSSEIIQRHGGKVWAESVVDKGSTFYFSLPLDEDSDILTGQ